MKWDPREAARNYVNISSVLAGFAFASVILVMQSPLPKSDSYTLILKNWASVAFLVGFFGCIVSSFTFSSIAGETKVSPRLFTLVLLGGSGFSISGCYIFWGLSTLTKLFLTNEILIISRSLFLIVSLLVPIYLVAITFDIYDYLGEEILKKSLVRLFLSAYAFIPLSCLWRLILFERIKGFEDFYFNAIVFVALMTIAFSVLTTVIAAYSPENFRLSPKQNSYWLVLHSFIYGSLLMMIP